MFERKDVKTVSAKEELKTLILSLTPEELEKTAILFRAYLLKTQEDPQPVPPTYFECSQKAPSVCQTAP